MIQEKTIEQLEGEIAQLSGALMEANETIEAIRSGQIDALVVEDKSGHQLYTLKTADQTYRVFIEKMREGAITINPEGMILYSNSSFAEMLHIPLSELIGSFIYSFIPEEGKDFFTALFNKGWEAESKAELSLLVSGDSLLQVLMSLTTLELDEGVALSVIITDLSIQKDAERQLEFKNEELQRAQDALEILNDELEQRVTERTQELFQSREHFKFLADNIPVMVWTASTNGDVTYFNKKWYVYTGLSPEDSIRWGWQKILHPDDVENTSLAWNEALKSGGDYYTEYRFLRASDGLYRWHIGTGHPFRNESGVITEWFGICVDIEDQKVAMTRKDEFISMASHELKTPLTIIKAFIQILTGTYEKENPKALEYVNYMAKQVNRLNLLIADLLDATKANAGEMIYDKQDFDFNSLLNEVVSEIQLTTKSHKLEVTPGPTATVYADRSRLSQVISNLISNAIKYSPHADTVFITSCITGDNVKLCVKDLGIGISKEQQPKLFNRFFRANEVKSNTFPGLGLGLYIANEIMKRHSGSISFTSEEAKGSTFCLTLPVKK